MSKLLTIALAVYCFVVQFGHLFKISSGAGTLGVSTGIVVLIIFMGFSKIPGKIRSVPVFAGFALLFGWFILSSSLSPTDPRGAYIGLGRLMLYLCLAAAVSSWHFTENRLKVFSYSVAIGLLFSSGLTIVDYRGWVNVPRCNERVIASEVESSSDRVTQAGGFFRSRSSMVAYFSLSVTMSLIMALTTQEWKGRALFVASGISGSLAIFLSHNRSGIVAIMFAMLVFLFCTKSFDSRKRMQIFALSGVMGIGLLIILSLYFPNHIRVYKSKLPMIFPNASAVSNQSASQSDASRSDGVRIGNLITALKEIGSNPIGNGLGRILTSDKGYKNTHNSFTTLIWAGGAFTLLWAVPFSIRAFKLLFANADIPPDARCYFDAFRFAVVAFFFNCMAHDSLGTGLFWIFLAVLISIRYQGGADLNAMQRFRYYSMAGARQAGMQ